MKRSRGITLLSLITLVAFVAIAVFATQCAAAEYWKNKYVRFSATAGETLATGDTVCIKGSDGKAYKADANSSSLRPAVGMIGKGGAANTTVEVIPLGVLAGQTAISPGARLFLSETAGALTTTAPTNAQAMGFGASVVSASSTTDYFISIMIPTSSGAGY